MYLCLCKGPRTMKESLVHLCVAFSTSRKRLHVTREAGYQGEEFGGLQLREREKRNEGAEEYKEERRPPLLVLS